jgi:hypothetical protein
MGIRKMFAVALVQPFPMVFQCLSFVAEGVGIKWAGLPLAHVELLDMLGMVYAVAAL